MAADRDPPTAADYAVTAASPALVMLMVGSLVFFLVEVLYAGLYSERLLYTLFFFVFMPLLSLPSPLPSPAIPPLLFWLLLLPSLLAEDDDDVLLIFL